MKHHFLKKLAAVLAFPLLLCCLAAPAASACWPWERERLPDSVLYQGTLQEIFRDEEGRITSLLLTSEEAGRYVMRLSETTVWLEYGDKTAFDPESLVPGETLTVFHSPVVALSLPAQSSAYAILRHAPQDVVSAQYLKVDSIRWTWGPSGTRLVTANNGNTQFLLDADTTFAPYRTKNIVTAQDLHKGSRIVVWYSDADTEGTRRADHIVLLPE